MATTIQIPGDCTLAGLIDTAFHDLVEHNQLDREACLALNHHALRPIVVEIVVSTLQRLSVSLPLSEQLLYAAPCSTHDPTDPAG